MSLDLQGMATLKSIANVINGVATLQLDGEIGGNGISGALFADEIMFQAQNPNVEEIVIKINSPGGSVADGISIFTAIQSCPKPVTTIVAGIAASIAGVIAMAGTTRKMNDFGRIMIHGVIARGENGEELRSLSEDDKTMLLNIRDMIAKIFENNSKKSFDEMVAIMSRTTWIEAPQALAIGLIDEIINTQRANVKFVENSLSGIYNQYDELLKEKSNPKSNKMKVVTNHLKLSADASEESVLNAVKSIENQLSTEIDAHATTKSELETANDKIEALEAENKALKEAAQDRADAEAVEYVENLIEAGTLKADDKDALIAQAKNDIDGFKALTNSIAVTTGPNLMGQIENRQTEDSGEGTFEGKTFRELEKENPAKLESLKNGSPEVYNSLYKAQYGVEYNG